MSVTRTLMALGSWSVQLAPETPQTIIDQIQYLGHITISTGRPDPRVSGDSLLTSARYTGVLRGIAWQQQGPQISGSGMAYWLGDENDKGPVITSQLLFNGVDLATAINGCMASTQSVRVGTIHPVSLGYTGYHQFVTIRKAIDFITSTVTDDTLNPVEWRVNGDATLDAGRAADLYGPTPTAAVVRRHVGADMALRALPGTAQVTEDVQDYATEVILLGQGSGLAISSAVASLTSGQIPYKDLFGNTVSIKRTVSQSSTNQANSLVQAQLALNQYANPRDAVQVSTDQFDIEGDVSVGNWVWVHDPDSSLVDNSGSPNEIVFRGERINPVKLRVTDMTWPVTAGMSVAYRGPDGTWLDLTDYVVWETGSTTMTVGGYNRSLTNPTGVSETLGSRAAPNTTIPNAPAFTPPFVQAIYQSTATGISKAQVQVAWNAPTNTDGTTITDGDHYEIRYRTAATPSDPVTWSQAAGKTWSQLATWAQPIAYTPGPWTGVYAPFDTTSLLVQELTPAVAYDFQIRAVDNGTPPNYSAWSATTTVTTNGDTIPPPQPAPPQVASSLIAVQITHQLGQAAGGTFNLPADLHHLEVHAQYEPTFTPSAATLLGKLAATNGMILSQTPVVGTFAVQSTANIYVKVVAVDESGNASNPSSAVQATASLIDDQHISNLTVSKLLAGTVTTDWLLGANIQTAPSGVRAGMNAGGFFAYDPANNRTFNVDATTGNVSIVGSLQSGSSAPMAIVGPGAPTQALKTPGMTLYATGANISNTAVGAALVYSNPEGVGTGPSSLTAASSVDSATSNVGLLDIRNNTAFLTLAKLSAATTTFPNGVLNPIGGYIATDATSAVVDVADSSGSGSLTGGQFYATQTDAIIRLFSAGTVGGGYAHQTSSFSSFGTQDSSGNTICSLDTYTSGILLPRGKWQNNVTAGTNDATWTSNPSYGSGFGGATQSYGASVSLFVPCLVIGSGAGGFTWNEQGSGLTSCGEAWSDTSAKTVHVFCFRV